MNNLPCISFLLLLGTLTTANAVGDVDPFGGGDPLRGTGSPRYRNAPPVVITRPKGYVDPAYEDTTGSTPAAPAGPLSPAKQELLNKACGASPQTKDLCISTLQSYPELTVKDLPGLAAYATQKLATEAENTMHNIEAMDEKTHDSSNTLKQKLTDCSEIYGDIADALKTSPDAQTITVTISEAKSCEDGFKPEKSPLTAVNDKYIQLANICLAISKAK